METSKREGCPARFYSNYSKLMVIQCYAPTNTAGEAEKLDFYERLKSEVAATPKHDLLIVVGDLYAKGGSDNTGREDRMGKHGSGNMNENGLFVDFCGVNGWSYGVPSSPIERLIRPHGLPQTKGSKNKLIILRLTTNGEPRNWTQVCLGVQISEVTICWCLAGSV